MDAYVTISDVQRFSLHDGPGLRTTVFFKGCPLRCRWCQNPEALRSEPELAFHAARCRATRECTLHCPAGAIRRDGTVDRGRCDACGRCVSACAFGAWEIVGRRVTVDALVEEATRDRPFFEASGGGVTLSGGEPTAQMEAMAAVARRLRERGIDVVLQTSGAFRWADFEPHLPLFSLIHLDLKALDKRKHRTLTGVGNAAILKNARHFAEAGAPVVFRTPLVPGFNDSDDDLAALATFVRGLGARSLHLLSYHRLGEAKLPGLCFPIPALDGPRPAAVAAAVARATGLLRAEGLEVVT